MDIKYTPGNPDEIVNYGDEDNQRDFAEERANTLVLHEECEGCHICRKGAYSTRATNPDNARKAYQTYLKDLNEDMSDVPAQTATDRREEQELDRYDMYDRSVNSDSSDMGDMGDAFYASDPYDEDCDEAACSCEEDNEYYSDETDDWDTPAVRGMWS